MDRAQLTDGMASGSPVLIVRNPGGISFEVLLDRALDIGWADARGVPLGWASARGRVAAVRHEPGGAGWIHTFGGGLLTTCGLASTGMPSTVGGIAHGLHGRIGHLAADNVSWRIQGEGDDAHVEIVGDIVEAALGTPTLRLSRRIRSWIHRPELEIDDVVVNDGFRDAGHMFRHHLNLGYPLLDEDSQIETDAIVFESREEPGVASFDEIGLGVSSDAVDEQVIYARTGARAQFVLTSPSRSAALKLEWSGDSFPLLLVWRDASPGVNVLGVEPSTSRDGGRAQAQHDDEVVTLRPGEQRRYRTRIVLEQVASPRERAEGVS
ncbi:DUF4432 family protein [Microbacterium sp. W4I4]|uniref:DUF4432 family protein n=1 Tax=Microbacterium sp. W4I4 TaxID=3042295 RepID=UPI0027D7C094|nr:DUF4432 family protein [Microbacterium sp. W4I4]